MYRSKRQAQLRPSEGEYNFEHSQTIEGEYQEMKDILNFARHGGEIPKTDVQYFRPDEIEQINSLYKASLDLTDIDALKQKNQYMQSQLEKAQQRKIEEQQKTQEEQKSETKTVE